MLSRVMQARAVRWTLLILLLLIGAAGAFVGYRLATSHEQLLAASQSLDASLTQMSTMVADIGAAQDAYVAPGQPDQPSIAKVDALARQLADASAAVRPALRSAESSRHLQDLSNTLDNFLQIDLRARESLLNDDDLSASALIFDDGRAALASMTGSLRALADQERMVAVATRVDLTQRLGLVVAGVAATWLLGLMLLVRTSRAPVVTATAKDADPAAADSVLDLRLNDVSDVPSSSDGAETPQPWVVDIATAADVCTAMSRMTSSDQLPDLLARAAVVLDASGIILWLGAGEELFAVTAHGYPPRLLARLGPIAHRANNATAAAWRTGELGIVPGDAASNGAIVAPLLGLDSCIGVLAVEVRHGREADVSARAVATMFAAQLATIVSAWPAPSSVSPADDQGDSGDPLAASL
jgi:hypothetical protein